MLPGNSFIIFYIIYYSKQMNEHVFNTILCFIILPIHEVSTGVIRKVSSGLVSLFRPVSAAMSTVGYETDTPISNSNNNVTKLAIIYEWIYRFRLNNL